MDAWSKPSTVIVVFICKNIFKNQLFVDIGIYARQSDGVQGTLELGVGKLGFEF